MPLRTSFPMLRSFLYICYLRSSSSASIIHLPAAVAGWSRNSVAWLSRAKTVRCRSSLRVTVFVVLVAATTADVETRQQAEGSTDAFNSWSRIAATLEGCERDTRQHPLRRCRPHSQHQPTHAIDFHALSFLLRTATPEPCLTPETGLEQAYRDFRENIGRAD